MEKKGYVVQSIGYEYDDETYYKSEGGGGHPQVVLTDEVLAKKRMMELEIKEWRGQRIGYYGYDIDEVAVDESEFERALESMGLNLEDWFDIEIPQTATDDQIKRLIKASRIRFYEIVEIQIEDSSELSDDEIGPTEEILEIQDSISKSEKKGIFDAVDQFTNPNVTPIQVPDNVTIEDIKRVVEETNDDFLSIKEQMKTLRDEARMKVKNFFIKGMNKIFEMYPEVKSVSWTQYTPYFNDGEPCEFWCNSGDFDVNGYSEYDDEGEEGTIDVLNYNWEDGRKYTYHKGEEIKNAIGGFLGQLDDDDYKTMFGDHARVIVRQDEIVIEEYEHD